MISGEGDDPTPEEIDSLLARLQVMCRLMEVQE